MKQCAICGKTYNKAIVLKKLRGKYNPTKLKKQQPNLQWYPLPDGGRIKICTKCMKAMHKEEK